jgi:hypothetical protein
MHRFARQVSPDQWQISKTHHYIPGMHAAMIYHPRWGYCVAWNDTPSDTFPKRTAGPFFIRGDSVENLFKDSEIIEPEPVE